MTVTIESYSDLIGDEYLNVSRADAIARELEAGWDIVAYAPDWLVGQKEFPASEFDEEVIVGMVDHETEKAYLLVRDGDEEWFPKSVIQVYEAAPDADIVSPQGGLDEFGEAA